MTCDAITRKTGKRLWAWEMRKTLDKKKIIEKEKFHLRSLPAAARAVKC